MNAMKLMVGGIITVVIVVLVIVISVYPPNSAEECRVMAQPNADRTVYNVAIMFGDEDWGQMSELEKAFLFEECQKKIKAKGKPAEHYMIYAKNYKTNELVFTVDSDKGLVEVGKYASHETGEEE